REARCQSRSQAEGLTSVQPFHVIRHPSFERKLRHVSERATSITEICLCKILIMRMRIIEIIRLKICSQHKIQNKNKLVKGSGLAAAEIIDPAVAGIERANRAIDHILHVNEIASLFTVLKNPWSFPGPHLLRQVINHT